MILKKMLLLSAFAAAVFFCISCGTTQKQAGPDLSKLTPEQRAEYEAYLNAKQRFEEQNFKAPESSNRTAAGEKSKKKFKYVPYSRQKRERLGDTEKAVLLDDDSSIFFWKNGSGRRSEKLHNQHVNEMEKSGISLDK